MSWTPMEREFGREGERVIPWAGFEECVGRGETAREREREEDGRWKMEEQSKWQNDKHEGGGAQPSAKQLQWRDCRLFYGNIPVITICWIRGYCESACQQPLLDCVLQFSLLPGPSPTFSSPASASTSPCRGNPMRSSRCLRVALSMSSPLARPDRMPARRRRPSMLPAEAIL